MTGFKRYSATFAEFAAANSLDYGTISAGIDLYTKDNFEDFVQFYEEKFNESFFQPHDYIIYFPSVLLIKIIHHDGQLISLRNS